jgi:PPM family protein phosphatase
VATETEKEVETIEVSFCGMTDVGRVRKNNEDNFVICDLTRGEKAASGVSGQYHLGPRGALLIVADGMGGEAHGEVASELSIATIPKRLESSLEVNSVPSGPDFAFLVKDAIEYANKVIFQMAQANPTHHGMGTTVTAAAILGGTLFAEQVGDSRAYLIRNGNMVQLTRDQTFLNYLADLGAEVPTDPETDSRRSILTQAVGAIAAVDVKITFADLRQEDRILVCSDGLYTMVKTPELTRIASGEASLEKACRALIDLANQNGGKDNVTVILAEVRGAGLPPRDPSSAPEAREFSQRDFSL